MRPDCQELVLERYPWLSGLINSPENSADGILTAGALDTFSNLYMLRDAKALYQDSLVVLVRILDMASADLSLIEQAFRDINYCTRCLDLCFRYSPDILVLVVGEACKETCPLEQISGRVRGIVLEYELSCKVLVGTASPSEDIAKTIIRLASAIRL